MQIVAEQTHLHWEEKFELIESKYGYKYELIQNKR